MYITSVVKSATSSNVFFFEILFSFILSLIEINLIYHHVFYCVYKMHKLNS